MAAAQPSRFRHALVVAGWILAIAGAIAAVSLFIIFLSNKFPQEKPKYSVAVAAVAGLDPARDLSARDRPTLSPVFNITVHIDNRRDVIDGHCIPDLSAAVVSYGDAFLGKGTVPKFCVRQGMEAEAVARVWGQDVEVPWFLRDQLAGELDAGEATVDVQMRVPGLVICKAKIGGGFSQCREPQ